VIDLLRTRTPVMVALHRRHRTGDGGHDPPALADLDQSRADRIREGTFKSAGLGTAKVRIIASG